MSNNKPQTQETKDKISVSMKASYEIRKAIKADMEKDKEFFDQSYLRD